MLRKKKRSRAREKVAAGAVIGRWPDEDARLKVEKGPILGSGLRVCWFLVPVSRNSGSIGPGQGRAGHGGQLAGHGSTGGQTPLGRIHGFVNPELSQLSTYRP